MQWGNDKVGSSIEAWLYHKGTCSVSPEQHILDNQHKNLFLLKFMQVSLN